MSSEYSSEYRRGLLTPQNCTAVFILKEHAGAYGVGIEYAYTLVNHAPQSAKKPQVVPKTSH